MAPHPKGYPSRQSQPVDCSKLKEKSGTHAANVTILLVLSHGSVGVTPPKKMNWQYIFNTYDDVKIVLYTYYMV